MRLERSEVYRFKRLHNVLPVIFIGLVFILIMVFVCQDIKSSESQSNTGHSESSGAKDAPGLPAKPEPETKDFEKNKENIVDIEKDINDINEIITGIEKDINDIDIKRNVWIPPRFNARQKERNAMLQTIKSYGLKDKAVLEAMRSVPRHEFVPEDISSMAYDDSPLPIGYGQTISQPFIVAEMTRLLKLKPGSRVLEIGTGSGYQAAVLAEFTPYVYTVEIIRSLARQAKERLKRLGYDIIRIKHGDGYFGWPEDAPFDAIIVTAASGEIPPPLIKQLKNGGRMVIPVGGAFATQSLILVEKDKSGNIKTHNLMPVRFVPLVRKASTEQE